MICVNNSSQQCCASLAPAVSLGSPHQMVKEFSSFIWRKLFFFFLHRAGQPFFESTRWKQWALLQFVPQFIWNDIVIQGTRTVSCSVMRQSSSTLCLKGNFYLFFFTTRADWFSVVKVLITCVPCKSMVNNCQIRKIAFIPGFGCLLCHQSPFQTDNQTTWCSDKIYDISFDFRRKMSVSEPGTEAWCAVVSCLF